MRRSMTILLAGLMALAMTGSAEAQKKRRRGAQPARPAAASEAKPPKASKVFDFTGLDVSGQLRAPQLLYFLDRANEEL